jgi:L-threonate 2-dehydrogenase
MPAATVAVLSPGEMGSNVGRILAAAGTRVLTCLEGRGPGSAERARDAGFICVPDLAALVSEAELIVSVVPPAAAEPLARLVAQALSAYGAPEHEQRHRPLYLDANSIGPETVERIATVLTEAGADFVDGCIIGGARDLRGRSRFYLSGASAETAAKLLQPLNVSVLGARPGQASAFKVLYAGVTKGLSAMGMELLAGAELLGVSDELLEKLRLDWPNVATFWARNLPELPPRAKRRAQEMAELAETLEHLGLAAPSARGAQAGLDAVAERYNRERPPESESVEAVIRWWSQPGD